MDKVEVKFGVWIEKGLDLWKKHLGILIPACLIGSLLSIVTCGILAGPMYAGLFMITLAMLDGKTPVPTIGDIFKGFSCFLQSFLLVIVVAACVGAVNLILMFIPCIGSLLSMLITYLVSTAVMFALPLVAEHNLDFWKAIQASYAKVKTNLWPFLGFYIVASLIGAVGVIACVIGIIVTAPLSITIMSVAYRDVFGGGPAPAPVAEPVPATPPPPPQA